MREHKRIAILSLTIMALGIVVSILSFHEHPDAQSIVIDWWKGIAKYIGILLLVIGASLGIRNFLISKD